MGANPSRTQTIILHEDRRITFLYHSDNLTFLVDRFHGHKPRFSVDTHVFNQQGYYNKVNIDTSTPLGCVNLLHNITCNTSYFHILLLHQTNYSHSLGIIFQIFPLTNSPYNQHIILIFKVLRQRRIDSRGKKLLRKNSNPCKQAHTPISIQTFNHKQSTHKQQS